MKFVREVDRLYFLSWICQLFPRSGREDVILGDQKVMLLLSEVVEHSWVVCFPCRLVRPSDSFVLCILLGLDFHRRQYRISELSFYVSAEWLRDQVRPHVL